VQDRNFTNKRKCDKINISKSPKRNLWRYIIMKEKKNNSNAFTGLKNDRYWTPDPKIPETMTTISESKTEPSTEGERVPKEHPSDYH
jgi:hypothetical protein